MPMFTISIVFCLNMFSVYVWSILVCNGAAEYINVLSYDMTRGPRHVSVRFAVLGTTIDGDVFCLPSSSADDFY